MNDLIWNKNFQLVKKPNNIIVTVVSVMDTHLQVHDEP